MKKKGLLSLFAALTLLSSCSNDIENPSVASSKGGKIAFNMRSGKQLRGTETTDNTMLDFAVGAWDVLGKDSIMTNTVVYKSDHGNSDWDYDGNVFWPNFGTVYFYAISPATDNGVTEDFPASHHPLLLTDSVTTIEYTTPSNIADMKDLLVAKQTGNFTDDGSSGVTLNFRHALARIKVDVYCKGAATATVTELALVNIKTKGNLELKKLPKTLDLLPYPTQATSTATLSAAWQKLWDASGDPGTILCPLSSVEVTENKTVTLVGGVDTDDIYVIPQTTTATPVSGIRGGVVGGDGEGKEPGSGFHIRIKYTQTIDDGAKNYVYYIPVPALLGATTGSSITFEMERQYHFIINVISGAGINFTASMGTYNDTFNNIEKEVPVAP